MISGEHINLVTRLWINARLERPGSPIIVTVASHRLSSISISGAAARTLSAVLTPPHTGHGRPRPMKVNEPTTTTYRRRPPQP